MAKLKSYQLIPRGKKGNYSLRLSIDGKDIWRSTKTANLKEAKKRAEAIVESIKSTAVLSQREASVHKITKHLAEAAVKQVTGKDSEKLPLVSAYDLWVSLHEEYSDIHRDTQKLHKSALDRFVQYVSDTEKIKYIDEVTPTTAKKYAKYLWEQKITPKTFNRHVQYLSAVFSTLDSVHFLPYRNPFSKDIVKRRKYREVDIEGHKAIEPNDINKLINKAVEYGKDYRDLFIIGANTGMRLKDACLLQWKNIEEDFIDIKLYKTSKAGNRARIPISQVLRQVFDNRCVNKSKYVLQEIAENYNYCPDTVRKKTKLVFESVFGKENTQTKKGKHRKINSSVLSFHSFRTTFMSLLASKDVSIRMAMRIMGWLSPEMIKVYERELEKARGEADKRSLELINSLEELQIKIPEVVSPAPVLKPTKEALIDLIDTYSNVTLGRIYNISEAAIRKHLNKHGIVRTRRIESADLSDEDIEKIRRSLMEGIE